MTEEAFNYVFFFIHTLNYNLFTPQFLSILPSYVYSEPVLKPLL